MISLTHTAYGSRVLLQGRSRLFLSNQARRAEWLRVGWTCPSRFLPWTGERFPLPAAGGEAFERLGKRGKAQLLEGSLRVGGLGQGAPNHQIIGTIGERLRSLANSLLVVCLSARQPDAWRYDDRLAAEFLADSLNLVCGA